MTALVRIERSWTVGGEGRVRPIRFCSRCGHPEEEPAGRPQMRKRVCGRCGMGVVLACARDALPGEAAAFLIVDHERRVCAVSEAGERYFGTQDELIGRDLLELVTSPLGDDQLSRSAELAAQRPAEPVVLPLRLLNGAAGRVGTMAGRIATCGPPRAALITVEPSGFGRG